MEQHRILYEEEHAEYAFFRGGEGHHDDHARFHEDHARGFHATRPQQAAEAQRTNRRDQFDIVEFLEIVAFRIALLQLTDKWKIGDHDDPRQEAQGMITAAERTKEYLKNALEEYFEENEEVKKYKFLASYLYGYDPKFLVYFIIKVKNYTKLIYKM